IWAQNFATEMWTKGLTTNNATIVAWDWSKAANRASPPEGDTPAQGMALGKALFKALGTNYSQPIHFIGHSLGALVNASAANYLNGEHFAQQEIPPTSFRVPIQITLLDEPEGT